MLEKSQEYLRLAIAAAAILIGLSVAYHYVIYIPERDWSEKLEAQTKATTDIQQAQAKQTAAEKEALARRTNYNVCISNALADYHSRWQSTCKRLANEADKNRTNCVANGGSEESCLSSYPIRPASDCALPTTTSETYGASLKDDQKQCLDEANAGVLDSGQ